jgi:hypothetical protein
MRRFGGFVCRPSDSSAEAVRGMDSNKGSPNDTPDARKKLRRDGMIKDIGIATSNTKFFGPDQCYQIASHHHQLHSNPFATVHATSI